MKYLDTHCLKARVIQLQGFLSFANVGQLLDVISLSMLKRKDTYAAHTVHLLHLLPYSTAVGSGRVTTPPSALTTPRSNKLQDLHGYFQPSDTTMTSETFDAVHTALLRRQVINSHGIILFLSFIFRS